METRETAKRKQTGAINIYVSSYDYLCVLIQLHVCPNTTTTCPHTTICVLILLYIYLYTTYMSSNCYICVLIRLYTSGVYVSSYYYICVLILLNICPHSTMSPHTTTYVSSYYYICVLKQTLLHVPPSALGGLRKQLFSKEAARGVKKKK